jgi:hypothetical protein
MVGPAYIARGGEQVFEPPFIAEEVQFFGFAVKANKTNLQAICDRYLNGPTGTNDFKPLGSYVLFVFNRLARLYAKNPPDNIRGWYSEKEAGIWMPVYDKERRKLVWYLPHIVVDNSYAMAMGREIYGFPKQIGWFNVPNGPAAPTTMSVETVVVEQLNPAHEAEQKVLFTARRQPWPTIVLPDLNISTSGQLIQALVTGLSLVDDVASDLSADELQQLLSVQIPMVFLKQFRDGVQPATACFQSVQELPIAMTHFHGARLYGRRYEIVFDDWESHPLRSELGLPADPIPATVAFWAKFDFEIGACTEIWRAPT